LGFRFLLLAAQYESVPLPVAAIRSPSYARFAAVFVIISLAGCA
jgi:hypothetical protein